MPLTDKLIDRVSSTLRLEQSITSEDGALLLVTKTYIGSRLVYSYDMDLEPLYEIFKDRLQSDSA
jgi:hypothetical protein